VGNGTAAGTFAVPIVREALDCKDRTTSGLAGRGIASGRTLAMGLGGRAIVSGLACATIDFEAGGDLGRGIAAARGMTDLVEVEVEEAFQVPLPGPGRDAGN